MAAPASSTVLVCSTVPLESSSWKLKSSASSMVPDVRTLWATIAALPFDGWVVSQVLVNSALATLSASSAPLSPLETVSQPSAGVSLTS